MDVKRLIVASVAVKGVYRRFQALSDEEKADVVNRVKTKLNGGSDSKEQVVGDDTPDAVLPAEEEPNVPAPEAPAEEAVDDDALAAEIDGIVGGGDEAPAEEGGDDDALAGEIDGIVGDGEAPADDGGMMGVVDGLVKEVEQIRSDGKIEPSEVLGLFDNLMQMVTLLVGTKAPPTPRKSK